MVYERWARTACGPDRLDRSLVELVVPCDRSGGGVFDVL